jgi:hypothetical protein
VIAGLFWMAVANAALLLAAHAVLRRVRTGNGPMNGLLFVLIHLLLISLSVLIAGIALAQGEHRQVRRPAAPEIGRATAVLAAMIALRMLLQVWFLAPSNGDALAYHLPKVAEWMKAGGFTREMGSDYLAPLPAGFELIEAWWVVFLHHDALIELAGVEFAVAAFLAVRLLARSLGLAEKSSLLAATLYVLTPVVALQATSCLNDGPVAALVLSMAALVAASAHPALLLIPVGLALGIKGTGIYTLPGWALLWFLRRKEPVVRPASLRAAALPAAAAIVAGAFWYARNLIWYGNPVFPIKGGPLTYRDMVFYIQRGPKLTSLRYNLDSLVTQMIYDNQAGFSPICRDIAGWGILAFSIGILALLQQIRKDRALRITAAAFLISMLTVFLMVNVDRYFVRFVAFFPAVLCIAAARLAESSRPAAILLAFAAAVQFLGTLLPQERPPERLLAMARQPWRERSAAQLFDLVPPGDPIAVYTDRRVMSYLWYKPDFSGSVVYLRVPRVDDLAEEMRRRGLRFVHVLLLRRPQYDFDDLVRKGVFRKVGDAFYALP